MWAWPFFRRIIIIVLTIWNIVMILIVVRMHSQLTATQMQLSMTVQNQRQMAAMMPNIVKNQETILYMCVDNINLYYMVQEYFVRFHKDAEMITDTREMYRSCYDQDH